MARMSRAGHMPGLEGPDALREIKGSRRKMHRKMRRKSHRK